MTRIPTITTDPQRGAAVAGTGVRGENSSAVRPDGDFLKSFLSFTPRSATQSITADLRFNQLVGALQLNRPSDPTAYRTPEPLRQPQRIEDPPREEVTDENESSADRHTAVDPLELLEETTGSQDLDPLWVLPLSTDRFPPDRVDHAGLPASGRYADQRSVGFPTAQRAAELESARQQGLARPIDAKLSDGDSDTRSAGLALAGQARPDVADGTIRLEGAWQQVAGEKLAGGFGYQGTSPRTTADSSGNIDLLRPGQLDSPPDGLDAIARERGGSVADEQELGWQLSFQSDRSGVRSGRLNASAKGKGRDGLKPDGGGLAERVNRMGQPASANPTTEPHSVMVGPAMRPSSHLSLDELSLAPAAARALSESGLARAELLGSSASAIAGAMSVAEVLSQSAVGSSAASSTTLLNKADVPPVASMDVSPSDPSAVGLFNRHDPTVTADVDGLPEVAGTTRPLPARVMNQVAEALRQAPSGDSTMRLQLNPVDLGQLSIEISFRDGVMHGKLRAEQGQTLKLLQDGLDGLKARLSEQGIVVQALEVELGQQGDFSQQSGSFSPGPDFGRQRPGRGYFAADGSARRATTTDREAAIQPTPRDTSGQWAVNVIV